MDDFVLARAVKPSILSRVIVCLATGTAASFVQLLAHRAQPNHMGDFAAVWFAARAARQGRNAYQLIGPGLEFDWPWHFLYPGTAIVAAMPLSFLPVLPALLIFVGLSAAVFTYSITAENWNRLPVLVSMPFIIAAFAAQWSPLLTAAFALPLAGLLLAAKPTLGAAIASAAPTRTQAYAVAGGFFLLGLSVVMIPHWPLEWLKTIRDAPELAPPILRTGGFIVLVSLLRWRRPEARLLLAMALPPQTGSWYEVVPLFLIPSTLKESMILSMTTSLGWLSQDYVMTATNEIQFNQQVGTLMIVFAYIPCLIMVLRRKNEGELPVWLAGPIRFIRMLSVSRPSPGSPG